MTTERHSTSVRDENWNLGSVFWSDVLHRRLFDRIKVLRSGIKRKQKRDFPGFEPVSLLEDYTRTAAARQLCCLMPDFLGILNMNVFIHTISFCYRWIHHYHSSIPTSAVVIPLSLPTTIRTKEYSAQMTQTTYRVKSPNMKYMPEIYFPPCPPHGRPDLVFYPIPGKL